MKKHIGLLLLPLALTACSSAPDRVDNQARGEDAPGSQASMEAKQLAAEQQTPYVAEIEFDKGSSKLTSSAQLKLERLLSRMQSNQNIESIKVLSWADQEYPAERAESLPESQRELAEKRNETIKNFVENVNGGLSVDTLSMAERPNEITRFLGTEDARIKESLETSGISLSGSSTGSAKANGQSKASKAIVMLMLKNAE